MTAITTTRTEAASLTVADQVLLVLAGAAALAVSARVLIPLPFTPVPVTGQTLAVLLLAAVLGPRRGVASVAAYLAAGLAGAPVFTAGGGPAYLLSPTFGYLLGFVPGVWIAGHLLARARGPLAILLALVAGDAAIFGLGLAYLGVYGAIVPSVLPAKGLLAAGLLPFLPGEAVKLALAGLAAQLLARK